MSQPSIFIALATAAFLCGCVASEAPKFEGESAVAALGDGGRFQSYGHAEGDRYTKAATWTLQHGSDGSYELRILDGGDQVYEISFYPIAAGNLVAQTREKGKHGYHYAILRIAGNEAAVYVPDCNEQDRTQLEKLGVVMKTWECWVDRVADPAAFFASLTLGKPKWKLVRE